MASSKSKVDASKNPDLVESASVSGPEVVDAPVQVVDVTDAPEVCARIQDAPYKPAGKAVLEVVMSAQNPVRTSLDEQREMLAGQA